MYLQWGNSLKPLPSLPALLPQAGERSKRLQDTEDTRLGRVGLMNTNDYLVCTKISVQSADFYYPVVLLAFGPLTHTRFA